MSWYSKNKQGLINMHKHRRNRASTTIAQAWRNRNRSKKSLTERTLNNNRTQIKKIKNSIETKMLELPQANAGNNFAGQNFVRETVDINGFSASGVALAMKPFRQVVQGDTEKTRNGAWISLKSLTYKIYYNTVAGLIPETNRVGVFVVLDRDPTNLVLPSLMGTVAGTPDAGTVLGGNSQLPQLRFQNLDTCGEKLRFKVLNHYHVNVQGAIQGTVYPPNITQSRTITSKYSLKYNAVGSPINQEIVLLFYSDSTVAPHPLVSVHARLRYKDA